MKIQTQVEAAILYDDIKVHNEGIYVFVNLDDKSLLNVCELIKTAPCKTLSSSDLHCTIMHCKTELPEVLIDVPEDRVMKARIESVTEWIDHKNRRIWVLALTSPDLGEVHESLVSQGINHSFTDYNPHITIAKDVPDNEQTRQWFEDINDLLFNNNLVIQFDGILKASPCS